jgi:hypothetical protein
LRYSSYALASSVDMSISLRRSASAAFAYSKVRVA